MAPTLTVTPESLKSSVKFTSSNEAVARVTGSEGAVVVIGVGKSIIKVEFEGNDYYNSAWNSYELTVTAAAATMALACKSGKTVEQKMAEFTEWNDNFVEMYRTRLAGLHRIRRTQQGRPGREPGQCCGRRSPQGRVFRL